jgi:hypothetical protein
VRNAVENVLSLSVLWMVILLIVGVLLLKISQEK